MDLMGNYYTIHFVSFDGEMYFLAAVRVRYENRLFIFFKYSMEYFSKDSYLGEGVKIKNTSL